MTSIFDETLIPLKQATKLLPSGSPGKKLSPATLFRWALRGCRGVVLETCLIGRARFTSREAIDRFSKRLSEKQEQSHIETATPAERRREHVVADKSLALAGW